MSDEYPAPPVGQRHQLSCDQLPRWLYVTVYGLGSLLAGIALWLLWSAGVLLR